MQDPTNTVAASRSHETGNSVKPKKKSDDSAQLNVKVRCPCGNSKPNNTMIKCIDPQCNIWQHAGCVVIPENKKSADSISPELPSCFYCEVCRLSRADPFGVSFWMTKSLLGCTGLYTLICKLMITDYLREGLNKIAISRNDSRTFCLGIRIGKRISLEQVLNLVPKEQDGEKFDDALARVRRCVGGGTEANNADSDSDIEVVSDSVSVNLRCPMTASRIQIAGRFKPCAHMGCFDLQAFIEIKSAFPEVAMSNLPEELENIIIDPYFNRITSLIKCCGDDMSEIDIRPDGCWRVKGGAELKDLAQWHLPDGTLSVATDTAAKSEMGVVKHEVNDEPLSEEVGCSIKLGIRGKSNGQWEISKRGDTYLVPSSDNDHARYKENKNCINLSSNINGANIADEGCIIQNQQQMVVLQLMSMILILRPQMKNIPPASAGQDIIVLSDSDDDVVTVLPPISLNCGSTHDIGNLFPPSPPEKLGACSEQTGGCPKETPFLALKEGFGDLGLSFWERPLSPRDDPTYQVLDNSTQVTNNPGEVENYTTDCQSKQGPVSGADLGVGAVATNPVADGHDGALQPCSSGERDGAIGLANLGDKTQTCGNGHSDKWTSVSISGSDEGLTYSKNMSQKRSNPGDRITALDASVVQSANDDEQTGERCSGPFSPPQQQRLVRQRLILSIDSDSD